MEFPVDLLGTVEPEALEHSAKDYMSKLLYRNPEIHESLSLPDSSEVEISLCNVSFVPLYGVDIKQKVLALFSPEDRFKAVGLYLLSQWWSAEDILKTADPSRTGLLEVRTPGERIVLYVLNRIIYRTKEKASDDIHFLCHEEHATAKIFWKSGEAIGFYSVKPEGSLCSSFLTQCYQLPIMDTIFIRKRHRGNGYGLQMLEDFVRSFKKDCLGVKYPLSPAMYKVCKNYLSTYPADKELLWEVEGIGGPFQRTLIAKKLQTMELKGDHQVVGKLNFETESTDVPTDKVMTQVQKTMEYTVEVVEEVVQIKIRKEVQDTPVTTRGRSSNLKRKKLGEDTGATTDKIIRVEDIEAAVQPPVDESMAEVVRSSLNVTEANLKETAVTVTHGEESVMDVTHVQCEEHKELFTESEETVLEVCALTKPITEPATVTPEEALEKTELFQMTPVAEIQSMKCSEETQVVKAFEATVGPVDLQPVELQQVVEVEIVKMTSGIEEVKKKTEEITGTEDGKGEVEEEISEKTVVAATNVVEEARLTCMQKPLQQTELDLKPVIMEESTTTEIRVLRKSSRVSTATPQRKSTRLHNELQVASKPCPSEAKAAPKQRSTQRSKAVEQESAQVVDQPEENPETRKEAEKEEVVDIVRDANEACSIQSKLTEEADDMNEVLTEKDTGSPQDAILEGEDMKIDGEKITAEGICQEGKELQNDSEIENREETSVVELAEVQDSETSEELSEPQKLPDVTGITDEDPEAESVEKEKAGGVEVEKIALHENVVGGAEETEKKNENMEIEEGTVNKNEAGVPRLPVIEKEHMEEVQEEEHMEDTSMVQESVSEKKKETEVQKPSHDNEVKSENRTELIEEEDAEKASSSRPTGKHDDGQRSNTATPLRRSQRFEDQLSEGELTRRVFRSGTKSVTAISKQKYVRHTKTVKQQEESAQAEGEHEVEQKEEILESHTGVAEGEKMETVRITSVEDNEHVKDDVDEESSLDKEYFEPETSDDHDLKKVEDGSQFENKVDEEDQVTTKDASLEDAETSGDGTKMAVIEFDDTEVVKDAEIEVEGKATLQSVGEPVEEQEEEAREMAQKKEVLKTQSLVEPAEKEQTDSKQLVEMADTVNTVMTEVIDKTETEENSKEKMENKIKAVSKDEDTAPELSDSGQGLTEVVQEEELLKESKPLREIPGSEELEIEDISKPSHSDEEKKSDNWTEPIEQEDSDKTDNSGSTGKHAASQRSSHKTPLRSSGRFKDQPLEGELTTRVLRSGTKSVTAISKQRHVGHTKAVKQQEEEPATETAQKEESTSDFTQQKAAVVPPSKQIGDSETAEETLQSPEEGNQELDKIAGTDENREESKEEEEVVQQTESLVEPAEKAQAGENETSVGSTQSQDGLNNADVAEKEDALTQMEVEESMTKSLKEQVVKVGAGKMLKTGSEQEESMLTEEKLKDDRVGEITLEEDLGVAVAESTAEMCTSDSVQDDRESATAGHEKAVQESSPEEETPIIISRSLRRRTVTVMSPSQRKSKHLQKTEVDKAENEHAVLVEVTHNTDKGIIEEAEENKDEKMEAEDSAGSKDEDRVPKSTDTDQGQMEVVQEEELLKVTKTLQEIPGNEETEIKEVSKPSCSDEEQKSDIWTESIAEKDSDKADNSGSTGKHADSRRPNYATPLRRSGRFKDQPVEDELTERVLRSGTKTVTAISKEKSIRHTKTVKSQEESAQAVGEHEVEQNEEAMESHTKAAQREKVDGENSENPIDSLQDESNVEKEYLEAEAIHDHDLKEVENKMEDGLQNETIEDGKKIVAVDLDEAEVVKDAEIDVEEKTGQETGEEQVEEPGTEMAQKEDGENVVESASDFTQQKAAVVLVEVPPKQTDDTETTEETSQSLEEADQELDKPASAQEDTEDSKEEEEVVKQIQSLDEPAENEETGGNQTSTETSQSQEADWLNKTDALAEMGVEEPMTKELVVVGADKMPKSGSEQEESMLADETLKDDRVGEIALDQESSAAVAHSAAELHTSESEKHQKEDQESKTSGHGETVQGSSSEEETPIIISRSLRRRTVTVMSPPQRKSKHLQKTEVELGENEHVVLVEVTDNTDKGSIEEAEENKDEKMEVEDSAVSDDEDRVPKSTETDQGQMEVVQEEELLKETKTLQDVPGNEGTNNKDVNEPSHGDEKKSDNWTEPIEQDESINTDNLASTGKHADGKRSNYSTPLRRSQRFKDQPVESELTKRVLRSGRKTVTAISKQKHVGHTKTVKQQEERAHAVGEPEVGQIEEIMESHAGVAEEEETVNATNERDNEKLTALQDRAQEDSGVEKEYLEAGATHVHDLKEVENKMEDDSQNETTEGGKKIVVVDLDYAEVVKDAEIDEKLTQQSGKEPVEKQEEEPATEIVQTEDGQNVVESMSVFTLQEAAVVLVDFSKVPPKQTGDSETLQSPEEGDEERDKLASTEENQEESKEEEEMMKQTELVELAEKEQTGENETSTETTEEEMGVEKPMTERIKECVMEVGADKMLKTAGEQEESMSTEEILKDDRAGEITSEEKSGVAVAESTAEMCTSESEKHQTEHQESVTTGHEEAVQESSPEEETPIITSRSLRRRTVTVISTPQRKSKRLQKTEVDMAENENVQMTEVMEKIDKSSIEEKEENKDEKMETEVSAIPNEEDRIPKSLVIDQGQMEVVEGVEHVKESSTPQEVPGNEELTIKELSESDLADKTEVADSYPAEVLKDAETEENKHEKIEAEDSTISKDEDRVPESTNTDQSQMEVEGPAVEMIPGQGEQKAEEATAGLKLQKASVVLVDFNKVPPKQTTDSVTAKEISWPQEEVCQEREAPADIGVYVEESKAEDEGMKQTETQTESAEKEQADEDVVKIAESENVETEDVKSKTAEGTSEIRDNNDEKMETEGDGVKEDEDRVPASIPEKEPVKETSTLQEIPSKTQIQEPSQADEEKSDIQIQEEFSDQAHKADRRKQEDNERPEVGTPVRRSKRFADQPALSELTTRVLRSSTKQVKATPKQRYTRQTKAMMQNEESELTVDKPEEKSKEIKELQTDVAEGEKMKTVITEGATENLITAVDGRVEENNELEPEQIEESVVAKDIRTETCSEDDKVTTEDEVEKAAEATTDEEKISDLHVSDIAKDAEMEVEGKTPARSVTEPVEEQAEAPVTEMAQNEDGQNAIKPTSALTLQKATVVLVDFNKVPPIQTDDSETTEETSQSQKEVDKQIDTGEDREESNEYEEEVKLTESLVESAEKEQTVGNEAAQPHNEEGPDKADVFEENEPLAEMAVEEPMTENLEEPDVDMGADNSLTTGSEQEETVLAEEKLKVGDILLEAESTATVSVCTNENQKGDQENITTGPEETVQEGSPEETAVTTSRSLRRRTVTVMSPPQRKSKRVQKPGVQADIGKAEAVKDTDVSEAEKTPAICLPTEVSMPEKDVEDASEHGKVTSETEIQECILGEQEVEALVAHEMPEKMLPDEGDAIMKESDDKEKGEMASDTAVSADAEATTIEVEKVLQVKSTEVDHEKDENIDEEMVLLVQDGDAQEKELEIPTGSPTNVVIEATTQAERMVEGEVDSLEKENNQNTSVTKPAQETTEEEVSEEEEEPIMTRNLRSRTVTAKYPMRRKSKRLCQEVAETPVKKAQPEKEAALVEASNERETVEPISAVEVKNEIKITETDSKDESEDAQVASEGTSKEVITLEEQGGENIAETDGEKVKKITDGENDMVEGVPEDKVEERTTEGANNEKVGMEIHIEGSDLIDNDMEKEPDKEEEGNAKPEQENSQEENILDKVEAQLLEEKSERESSLVKEKTQIKEPEDKEKSSTTEEILDEVEEALSVERRSLRKRTITIKATSERKSKRMRKQDQDETEQVHVYITEDPLSVEQPVMERADVKSLAEEETTGEEIADDTEKDGETLLEKVQEQENPEGEETCGETNISTEKEKDGPKQAQSRELINVSEEETDTKTDAQKGEKAEEEGEDKAEADEYKEEAAEHENKITDKGDRTADTVVEEGQEEAEPNEKNGNECNEISLTLDESFTLELEEEDENNSPQKNKVEEMEASLMECLHVASTTIHKTDKCEDQEEEPAVKKRQVLQGRSSAAASPEQRSTRWSKRFLMESQSEMEGRSEVKVAEEEEGKKKPQQKRKAIVDQTPRRSKRLARPKFV